MVTVVVCALMTLGIVVLAFTVSHLTGGTGSVPGAGGASALMAGEGNPGQDPAGAGTGEETVGPSLAARGASGE